MYIDFGVEFGIEECLGLDDSALAELVVRRLGIMAKRAKWLYVDTIKEHILSLETERLLSMRETEAIN